MTFADRLKSLRADLGISQVRAAEIVRISKRQYKAWESGHPPSYPAQVGAVRLLETAAVKQGGAN